MPHPWECSKPGWMELWTWSNAKCPCLWQVQLAFKVRSNPNHLVKNCRDDQSTYVTRGGWDCCVGYVRKTDKMGNVIATALLLELWGALKCGWYQIGYSQQAGCLKTIRGLMQVYVQHYGIVGRLWYQNRSVYLCDLEVMWTEYMACLTDWVCAFT